MEQKIKWGTIHNGAALKIEGLATGDDTLVVHNAGMKVGNTFITQTFSITQYPALTIKSSEVKEATCSNTPDGQLLMETEGGNPSRFTYLISPATGKQQSSGRTIICSDLLPGIYAVVIKDACNQLASRDIEVTRKTAQLQGQVAVKTEAINEFANGALNVSLENGSGKYRYSVWSNNVMMAEKETSSPYTVIATGFDSARKTFAQSNFKSQAKKTGEQLSFEADLILWIRRILIKKISMFQPF